MDKSHYSHKVAKAKPEKRSHRPPGLRGKDIGLFYRDVKRAQNAEEAAQVAEKYAEKVSQYVNSGGNKTKAKSRKAQRREERKEQKKNPVSS